MKYSDSTLMRMSKKDLILMLRTAEENRDNMEALLNQQYENVKDWQPVVRCKDCKHWNCDQLSEAEIEWHNCNDPLSNDGQVLTHSEWYCPNGKRRMVR